MRRLTLGLLTTLAALVGIAFVALLLRLLAQPELRARVDLTHTRSAALSGRTAAALASLPEASRAVFFLYREDPRLAFNGSAVYPRAFAALRTAAEDARIRSRGRLQVQVLDESSPLVEQEQARVSLSRAMGETVILEAERRRQVLRFDQLFEVSQPSADGRPAQLRGQRIDLALGDAARKLARAQLPRVAVVSAVSAEGAAGAEALLADLAGLLADEGYEAGLVTEVPAPGDGFDLLLVPGQNLPFLPADEDNLRAWMASGRPLLLGLGATAGIESPGVVTLWNELLADRGIAFESGLVCERFRGQTGVNLCGYLEVPAGRLAATHPVTRRLHAERRVLPLAGVRPLAIRGGTNAYTREQLVGVPIEAWVEPETDLGAGRTPDYEPAGDRKGGFPIAVAAETWKPGEEGRSGRTVIVGTASLFYGDLSYSRDFLAAAFRWLLAEEEEGEGLVALESLPFRPTREQRARLANLAVLMLPGVTMLLGLLLYWRRRR